MPYLYISHKISCKQFSWTDKRYDLLYSSPELYGRMFHRHCDNLRIHSYLCRDIICDYTHIMIIYTFLMCIIFTLLSMMITLPVFLLYRCGNCLSISRKDCFATKLIIAILFVPSTHSWRFLANKIYFVYKNSTQMCNL